MQVPTISMKYDPALLSMVIRMKKDGMSHQQIAGWLNNNGYVKIRSGNDFTAQDVAHLVRAYKTMLTSASIPSFQKRAMGRPYLGDTIKSASVINDVAGLMEVLGVKA